MHTSCGRDASPYLLSSRWRAARDRPVDQHELLIRLAVAWADKAKQPLDRDLLGAVL